MKNLKRLALKVVGDKGSRTPDLLNAIQALYQLSYTPTGKAYYSMSCAKKQRLCGKWGKFASGGGVGVFVRPAEECFGELLGESGDDL